MFHELVLGFEDIQEIGLSMKLTLTHQFHKAENGTRIDI